MINLNKSKDYFDPKKLGKTKVHIVGCGATGSFLADMLVRSGIDKITLWDFDIIESHNVVNQLYDNTEVGMLKTDALAARLLKINDSCRIIKKGRCAPTDRLSGYVFLAVDNIDTRRDITTIATKNKQIKAMFDIRLGLEDGTILAADWKNEKDKEQLLASMCFTHEEAKEETPTSACGMTLSVSPTVHVLASLQVANFINFINTAKLKKFATINVFNMFLDSF
jgi:molybdopterin/thiamine biosynthesis adenylyltransferase